MFTGIVEAVGRVVELGQAEGGGRRLVVAAPHGFPAEVARGDSVAISGVCLTAVLVEASWLAFDLAEETLRVTTLGALEAGARVNLERPMRLGERLGGHLVLGHVDGVGVVTAVTPEGTGRRLTVRVESSLAPLLIPKGSVAVDGVSLTVAALTADGFSVALIPHTLAATTLGDRGVGAGVNLEMDVIGKYVRALLPVGVDARDDAGRQRTGES